MPDRAYIVGTVDTKADELRFVRDLLRAAGVATCLVDVGVRRGRRDGVDVGADEVARCGAGEAILDLPGRSEAVAAMGDALAAFLRARGDVGGVIGCGGSGNTSLVTRAMRALPLGVPKVMVSTVLYGDVSGYIDGSDICLMYAVADVAGLNRISRRVLGNAAHALAGMMRGAAPLADERRAIGLTMFGVTTPCVDRVRARLERDWDCLVFHATGQGGRTLEKLVDAGEIAGVVDITTTEVADHLFGGVCSAGEDRLGAIARTRVPYVGSVGAQDIVNFGPLATVPERYRARTLHPHSPHATLMRTTPEENTAIGRWIGERLNACAGPVRFLLPEGGVSALDAPGRPFRDAAADAALFAAIEATVRQDERRRVIRLPHHINDQAFADAAAEHFTAIAR